MESETYQTEDVSKASGPNLLRCPTCDVRAYVQANCCRVFHSPLPSCRTCQEKGNDFTFHQSCFPQFLQPAFHNGLVSPCCCNHGSSNLNLSSNCSKRGSVDHECGNARRKTTPYMCCHKMKKNPLRDNSGEENGVSENEASRWSQCQNQTKEPQCHYQLCDCGEFLPRTCCPFIIPIVSYCVLWNPQNSTENRSNYCSNQMENSNRKSEDRENDLYSNTESNEKYDAVIDVEAECAQEDYSEDGMLKKETEREHNRSSSSFLSLHSSANENKIYNKEKSTNPSINGESSVNSEEEATEELQIDCRVSSSTSQNNLTTENVLRNIVDYSDVYSAENESRRSSQTESEFDLKAEDSSTEAEEIENSIKHLHVFSEENDIHITPKISLESFEGKNSEAYNNPEVVSNISKQKTNPKKLIKNFTVTSRTESALQEKPKTLAAGGDLGGDTCVGFKVNIESEESEEAEETQLENTQQGITRQNLELKRSSIKDLQEKKSSLSFLKASAEVKAVRAPRTGIAKLIQDNRTRDFTKSINTENKESNYNDPKRKVFPNDSQMREQTSKTNEKSPNVARPQKTGLEKQNPTSNFRFSKKEEKFSAPKVRLHNCDRNSRK